jgi:NADH:ubiquinone oxidoreductase subunit
MVKYRVKKDWASYELTRTPSLSSLISAQWQSWLRHSRAEPPSVQELIADAQRRENTRRLAQIADARWATERGERPAVTSGEDALNGNIPIDKPEFSNQTKQVSCSGDITSPRPWCNISTTRMVCKDWSTGVTILHLMYKSILVFEHFVLCCVWRTCYSRLYPFLTPHLD